jgi:hypothetical protein
MAALAVFVVMAVATVLEVCLIRWGMRRYVQIVRDWASANGYCLVRKQFRLFRQGPLTWDPYPVVLRVTVANSAGEEWSGWIGVSGLGIWRPQAVRMEWDDSGHG